MDINLKEIWLIFDAIWMFNELIWMEVIANNYKLNDGFYQKFKSGFREVKQLQSL